jgi:hypothetical protein
MFQADANRSGPNVVSHYSPGERALCRPTVIRKIEFLNWCGLHSLCEGFRTSDILVHCYLQVFPIKKAEGGQAERTTVTQPGSEEEAVCFPKGAIKADEWEDF